MWVALGVAGLSTVIAVIDLMHATEPDPPDVVGRWCDTPAGEIVIRQTDQGLVARVDVLKDAVHRPRLQRAGDAFITVGSNHGDGFRILANGDLELFDEQGRIRVATKARGACRAW